MSLTRKAFEYDHQIGRALEQLEQQSRPIHKTLLIIGSIRASNQRSAWQLSFQIPSFETKKDIEDTSTQLRYASNYPPWHKTTETTSSQQVAVRGCQPSRCAFPVGWWEEHSAVGAMNEEERNCRKNDASRGDRFRWSSCEKYICSRNMNPSGFIKSGT